jgi:hypothetical protein
MSKLKHSIPMLAAVWLPVSALATPPTMSELLQIQQNVNTACLVRGQGRARMICRCAAVVVSNKLATEGTLNYPERAEALFVDSFEFCTGHEDRGFISATAKLFQSKTAVEESLQGVVAKP